MAVNEGGQPRYDIHNLKNFSGPNGMTFAMNVNKLRNETQQLANYHKKILEKYINNK